ncbi:MAG: hypothetical protein M3R31_02205 [Pseudomonadota bacterium]|nr:hypothetical protein [Pseudomonadota bacterium]
MHPVSRLLLAALLTLMSAAAGAQTRFGLSPEAYAVFSRWMLASCIGGEEAALTGDLRRYPQALARAFEQAITASPSTEEVRAVRAAAEGRYDSRAKFPLEQFRIEGVNSEDVARFSRVSRQQYVDDQVQRFITGYRSNAVAGLAIVGDAKGRSALARIAGNSRDPLAPAAREALKRR